MGLDFHYQALPPDSELIRRSRVDPQFGSELEFFHYLTQHLPVQIEQVKDKTRLAFLTELERIIAMHPGIIERNLYLGRHWDMLHFMLSAVRRGENTSEPDWAQQAIHGGAVLHPEAVSVIGFPIKYLTPQETGEIWERLYCLDVEEIGAHWSIERMKARAVYKYNQMREDDWLENFERFKKFYFEATVNKEAVIIVRS